MVSKFTICFIIVIAITLVWAKEMNKKQMKQIAKKQKEMRAIHKRIAEMIPKKMDQPEKTKVRKILAKFMERWQKLKDKLIQKGKKDGISDKDVKELEKQFEKTRRSVEKKLKGKKRRFSLPGLIIFEKISDSLKQFGEGDYKVVELAKRIKLSFGTLNNWIHDSIKNGEQAAVDLGKVFDKADSSEDLSSEETSPEEHDDVD